MRWRNVVSTEWWKDGKMERWKDGVLAKRIILLTANGINNV